MSNHIARLSNFSREVVKISTRGCRKNYAREQQKHREEKSTGTEELSSKHFME